LLPVHLDVLRFLSQANRYSNTPAAVAEFLGSTKGTISQSLQVLERGAFIRKRPDRQDRRVVRLELTARGRKVVAIPPRFEETIDGVPVAEISDLTDRLESFLRRLQRASGNRSFGVCKTCRHYRREAGKGECGLTGEPLSVADSKRICREHEEPTAPRKKTGGNG
jgi:DNA-binding MarR family transcriptional regulator